MSSPAIEYNPTVYNLVLSTESLSQAMSAVEKYPQGSIELVTDEVSKTWRVWILKKYQVKS
jgi:hypothetical protein